MIGIVVIVGVCCGCEVFRGNGLRNRISGATKKELRASSVFKQVFEAVALYSVGDSI